MVHIPRNFIFFRRIKCLRIWHGVVTAIILGVIFLGLLAFASLGELRFFAGRAAPLTGLWQGEKTYVLLIQNNTELRPTGGFISAYGILQFDHGRVKKFEIHDVYDNIDNHEYQEPPYPLGLLLKDPGYQGHTFRDANFYGDFPESVNELETFFSLVYPDIHPDGVMAVNYSVIEDVLEVLEEVTGDDGHRYTSDNLFSKVEYQVNNIDRHNEKALADRKSVLGSLAGKIMKQIVFSPLRWRQVCDVIVKNLYEKNIQLFFHDEYMQSEIVARGWSGMWPENWKGDFLAVVEGNFGGMKSDRYIKRDVSYFVQIQRNTETGAYEGHVRLNVEMLHTGVYDIPMSGSYKGYMRAYIPKGSTIISTPKKTVVDDVVVVEDANIYDEDDYAVLGNIVRLEPGQQLMLEYEYVLPSRIAVESLYQLHVEKQSGTNDHYRVIVQSPQERFIQSDEMVATENVATFDDTLERSKTFSLHILPDVLPPRVVLQQFESLNSVILIFNEDMARGSAEDLLNLAIRDMDYVYKEITDPVKIVKAEHLGRAVKLTLEGVTRQKQERYIITLRNFRDVNGNFLSPNPMEITVVQPVEEL